jgi:RNA polymerase sigma-70 factor (ECF subfamily)
LGVAEHPTNTQAEAYRGAIRARDHSAWTSLTKECYPVLLRYAKHNLPPQGDAEAAVQEALYRAFRKARRYDGERSPFPWLAAFCMNECWRQRRAMARRLQKPDWLAVRAAESPVSMPDGEAKASVESALEALPLRQHQVLSLRFGFRLSCREVAQALGISTKATQIALTRGLLRLRSSPRSHELRELLSSLQGERNDR